MHLFTSHRDQSRRYLAHFDLPTHPLCWLRGHRAAAEVIDSKYTDTWVLVMCRTCGIRHSDPYLSAGRRANLTREDAKATVARQVEAARHNNDNYAKVRDGRDGYGHHRLELVVELVSHTFRRPGLHVHLGDRWSETPIDGSIHTRNRSAYFSIGGVGNRLAHRLTRGQKRDIYIGAKSKES